MDNIELQKLLNSPDRDGNVYLPMGEYEGPFAVNVPCRIIGSDTTLYASRGAVLTVNAKGTSLEKLRIELTGSSLTGNDAAAVRSYAGDTAFEQVEIIGRLAGIAGEEEPWGIPNNVNLGKIPPDRECRYTMELILPVEAELVSLFYDVSVYPTKLSAGKNIVEIKVDPVREGTYIYGEILLKSKVTRRICLSGYACEDGENLDGRLVFSPAPDYADEANTEYGYDEIIYPSGEAAVPETIGAHKAVTDDSGEKGEPHSIYIITRGMHVIADCDEAEIEFVCDNKGVSADIEAFLFMTDRDGLVRKNDRFVFFGNDKSGCGSVKYLHAEDKKAMFIRFGSIPIDAAGIDIAYSIYDTPKKLDFSMLKNPAISVKLKGTEGTRELVYPLEKPLDCSTLVGLGINYEDSCWKISPLGMIYPKGLSALCGNYGIMATL